MVLKAFASGGSALTGTEAISNGVSIFRRPEWRNARTTLVSWRPLGVVVPRPFRMAARPTRCPTCGSPTVISQVGKSSTDTRLGNLLYFLLQVGTTFILVLAANTSFADFPRLASFAAADTFMPRQLTKRAIAWSSPTASSPWRSSRWSSSWSPGPR